MSRTADQTYFVSGQTIGRLREYRRQIRQISHTFWGGVRFEHLIRDRPDAARL